MTSYDQSFGREPEHNGRSSEPANLPEPPLKSVAGHIPKQLVYRGMTPGAFSVLMEGLRWPIGDGLRDLLFDALDRDGMFSRDEVLANHYSPLPFLVQSRRTLKVGEGRVLEVDRSILLIDEREEAETPSLCLTATPEGRIDASFDLFWLTSELRWSTAMELADILGIDHLRSRLRKMEPQSGEIPAERRYQLTPSLSFLTEFHDRDEVIHRSHGIPSGPERWIPFKLQCPGLLDEEQQRLVARVDESAARDYFNAGLSRIAEAFTDGHGPVWTERIKKMSGQLSLPATLTFSRRIELGEGDETEIPPGAEVTFVSSDYGAEVEDLDDGPEEDWEEPVDQGPIDFYSALFVSAPALSGATITFRSTSEFDPHDLIERSERFDFTAPSTGIDFPLHTPETPVGTGPRRWELIRKIGNQIGAPLDIRSILRHLDRRADNDPGRDSREVMEERALIAVEES